MNLFINSPAYYSQNHGVVDEIYKMCRDISEEINVMDYTSSLETIGIIPILAPKELMEQNQWLGHVKISIPYKMAVVSLNSSYEHFCAETLDQKMEIILNNILESLQLIKKKLKGKFHYEDMEKAILEIGKRHIELQRFRMANGK